MNKKVYTYVRRENRAENLTLKEQITELQDYAKSNKGLEVVAPKDFDEVKKEVDAVITLEDDKGE